MQEWQEQIKIAFEMTDESGSVWPYLSHFVTFFWKVIFSFIPPATALGGWATFLTAIAIIALLTAIMGDLAIKFGCSLGWDMHTTSVTVVAIGTSMPDLFASRVAAVREHFADSAIGNINGSNAFNVFLGLGECITKSVSIRMIFSFVTIGFPWLCATIYHQLNGSIFVVSDLDDLSFSVQIFILFSALHLVLLTVRRKLQMFGRGELGGPRPYAYLCFAVLLGLWLFYIVLCIVR